MRTAAKRKWVKALRSGEYSQCRESWRDDTGYCCLGVLLEINGEMSTNEPRAAAERLTGISGHPLQTLINMNDMEHLSFVQIADYIEENL